MVYRDKNYSIYESEYYLPLGIVTDSDLSQCTELPKAERIVIQEYLAKNLLDACIALGCEIIYPVTMCIPYIPVSYTHLPPVKP